MTSQPRLNGQPQEGQDTAKSVPAYLRCWLECGTSFRASVKSAEFCGQQCRKVFNNRRQTRGADLYDLLMSLRYEREASKREPGRPSVFTMLCRMARDFRDEDREKRSGRKSWRPARKVLARGQHTHLYSITIVKARKNQK